MIVDFFLEIERMKKMNEEVENILTILKETPLSYSDLKTKAGYGRDNSREFVNLVKLGLRLNFIHRDPDSKLYYA